jgi:tRNA(Ile2) C34 agmatinyltransferase TiaS
MAEFVDTRPVELATFRCPRCRRKMEELARARLTCPLCGVRMVKQKAGPVLVDFQCPDCSRRLAAVPSAEVRCKCGRAMMRKKIHRDERKPTVQSLFEALKNK